jgi:molybdate transport system substrate-binding protein
MDLTRLRMLLLAALLTASAPVRPAELTVSAAASLREAFTQIGQAFEATNPGSRVLFNFAASGQLVQQIRRGAPVDVLATADQESMDRAERQNLILRNTRGDFARNRLVLATPADAVAALSALSDLTKVSVRRIAIGSPDSVPAGRYAKAALEAAGLWSALEPKLIQTQSVRQALDYLARGETDAGFVYLTDALLAPQSVRIAFEVAMQDPILYPIAVVRGGGNERLGRAFIAFLYSDTAQKVFARYGFLQR